MGLSRKAQLYVNRYLNRKFLNLGIHSKTCRFRRHEVGGVIETRSEYFDSVIYARWFTITIIKRRLYIDFADVCVNFVFQFLLMSIYAIEKEKKRSIKSIGIDDEAFKQQFKMIRQ